MKQKLQKAGSDKKSRKPKALHSQHNSDKERSVNRRN